MPRAAQKQNWRRGLFQQIHNQIQQRLLSPVDVVDHPDRGPVDGELLEHLARGPEDLLNAELLRRQPNGGSDPIRHGGVVDEGAQLRDALIGSVGWLDAGSRACCLHERPEGDAFTVW